MGRLVGALVDALVDALVYAFLKVLGRTYPHFIQQLQK